MQPVPAPAASLPVPPHNVHRLALRVLRLLAAIALAALAVPACASAQPPRPVLRTAYGNYELEVLVDGWTARTYAHRGETYILGQQGDRYTLRVHNRSNRRVEAVVSIDGRDVLDGGAANYKSKRGYLVPAWGSVDIDGWRLSNQEVAAFRFSSVAESYAAQTGSARDVGVIGVAIFPERERPVVRYVPPPPPPYEPWRYHGAYDTDDSNSLMEGSRAQKSDRAPSRRSPGGGALGSADAMGESYGRSAAPSAAPPPESRPGLGTEFGERQGSYVETVRFVRANPRTPAALFGARYNDRDGLLAMGIAVDGYPYGYASEEELRETATPFPGNTGRGYARPPRNWRWR